MSNDPAVTDSFPSWGPAPTDRWITDILGPGFYARSLPVGEDEHGQVCATLVNHDPGSDPQMQLHGEHSPDPTFTLLYVHGWNDYFFQRELARHTSAAGGAFYAMDLERFGRSLRPGQTFGWVEDLKDYDRDFAAAIKMIRAAHPDLPLVIMGHSMGGLITTTWVGRHPGIAAGLILNSPWLSHFSDSFTSLVARARAKVHNFAPEAFLNAALPLRESDIYAVSLGRWDPAEIPASLQKWRDDPALAGWDIEPAWKRPTGRHMRFGWLGAIFNAQSLISNGLRVDVPVFLGLSTSSPATTQWNPLMHFQDVVLSVKAIMRHGPHLSRSVTVERFHGIHDLILSIPPVRQQFWEKFHSWLLVNGFETQETYDALGFEGRTRICP